jgi:enoyl-CoA hydratase/carnithine racemase
MDLNVQDGVAALTLRRPAGGIATDTSVKVVVVRGEGRVFSAGADIKMMASFLSFGDGVAQLTAYAGRLQAALNRLAETAPRDRRSGDGNGAWWWVGDRAGL